MLEMSENTRDTFKEVLNDFKAADKSTLTGLQTFAIGYVGDVTARLAGGTLEFGDEFDKKFREPLMLCSEFFHELLHLDEETFQQTSILRTISTLLNDVHGLDLLHDVIMDLWREIYDHGSPRHLFLINEVAAMVKKIKLTHSRRDHDHV